MTKWVKPRTYKPEPNSGILVIESDDGNEGDHSRWFPMYKEISYEKSQFYPFNIVKATYNVNSGTIGDNSGERRKMTVENLLELEKYGYEISNHGRHHIGIGLREVTEAIPAGSTSIKLGGLGFGVGMITGHQGKDHRGIYTYEITEGELSEEFKVIDGVEETKELYLDRPLTNSYTTDAKVQVTEKTAELVLKGGRDDIRAWGLYCNNYAYPWHDGSSAVGYSEKAMNWAIQYHDTARGHLGILNKYNYDRRRLMSRPDNLSFEEYDNLLDTVKAGNNILIIYGHGDHERFRLGNMEYVARGALERGMRIMTRRELVVYLNGL